MRIHSISEACFRGSIVLGTLLLLSPAGACASPNGGDPDDAASDRTPQDDASFGVAPDTSLTPVDKASRCASSFGTALAAPYGRLDGTITAVVKPAHPTCAMPNSDHVVVQVSAGGEVYRIVVNVLSSFADDAGETRIRFGAISKALKGPAWSEGWNTGVALDYVADLGLHNDLSTLQPMTLAEASLAIDGSLSLDEKVSVFATTSGGASAHKVHRNEGKTDGAIVVGPDTASPKYLVFAFSSQSF